jgi:hypothetical protein
VNLLRELEPITASCPFFSNTPRRDGDRKSNDQKSRQMMRPDINQIEVKRERQHHHRVLGAQCWLRTICLSFSNIKDAQASQ